MNKLNIIKKNIFYSIPPNAKKCELFLLIQNLIFCICLLFEVQSHVSKSRALFAKILFKCANSSVQINPVYCYLMPMSVDLGMNLCRVLYCFFLFLSFLLSNPLTWWSSKLLWIVHVYVLFVWKLFRNFWWWWIPFDGSSTISQLFQHKIPLSACFSAFDDSFTCFITPCMLFCVLAFNRIYIHYEIQLLFITKWLAFQLIYLSFVFELSILWIVFGSISITKHNKYNKWESIYHM